MIINKKPIYLFILLVAALGGCSKQNGFGSNTSGYNPGQTPIVVSNAVDYRPDPTVTASLSGDQSITITLSLSGNSGRSLKQITGVVASTSYTAIQNPASKLYNAAPIAGSNNSATFQTSLSEYQSHFPTEKMTANTELANRFYFQVTLDDGSIVYPTPVRVLVLQ